MGRGVPLLRTSRVHHRVGARRRRRRAARDLTAAGRPSRRGSGRELAWVGGTSTACSPRISSGHDHRARARALRASTTNAAAPSCVRAANCWRSRTSDRRGPSRGSRTLVRASSGRCRSSAGARGTRRSRPRRPYDCRDPGRRCDNSRRDRRRVIVSVPHSCSGSPRTFELGHRGRSIARADACVDPVTGHVSATNSPSGAHTLTAPPTTGGLPFASDVLVIAIFVTACLLAGAGLLAVSGPASAAGSPSGVLISQLRTRSATSTFDEYVQITNTTSAAVDLSGWQLEDCFSSSGTQRARGRRQPARGRHDAACRSDVRVRKDDGDYNRRLRRHLQLPGDRDRRLPAAERERRRAGQRRRSRVAVRRGDGLTFPTTGSDFVFTRKAAASGTGLQDTDNNAADFLRP